MILVTGGAGFIGSAFVRKVENPVVYDALTYSGRLENLQVAHIFIKGDIRDKENLEKVIKGLQYRYNSYFRCRISR